MIRDIRRLGVVGKATTMFLLFYLQKWVLVVTRPPRIALLLRIEQEGEIIGKYFMKCDSRWAIKYDARCGMLANSY